MVDLSAKIIKPKIPTEPKPIKVREETSRGRVSEKSSSDQIEELQIPALKEGQVLVKIAYSGVCHSQLNEVRGLKGIDKFLPHTLGHEGAGIVQEIGPEVSKVNEGDSVVLTWIKGNGFNIPSAIYTRRDGSKVNSGAISTFIEYAVVSENRLIPVSKRYGAGQRRLCAAWISYAGWVTRQKCRAYCGIRSAKKSAGLIDC